MNTSKINGTISKTYLSAILLFVVMTILMLTFVALPHRNVAMAGSITDMVDEEVVKFYEEKIAGDNFISSMSQYKIKRLMEAYNVDRNRLYTALILSDLGGRVDNHKNVDEIAQMKDKQLISYGKTVITAYIDTLSEEEKEALKSEFKALLNSRK